VAASPVVVPSVMVSDDVPVNDGAVPSRLKLPTSTLWLVVTLLGVVTLVEDTTSEALMLKLSPPSV